MASIAVTSYLQPSKAKESWAVITDEPPSLQTLWQYFQVSGGGIILDSKSGAFELQESHCVPPMPLNAYTSLRRSLFYATTQGWQ